MVIVLLNLKIYTQMRNTEMLAEQLEASLSRRLMCSGSASPLIPHLNKADTIELLSVIGNTIKTLENVTENIYFIFTPLNLKSQLFNF
jgi:hypothetical protein